MSEFYTVVYHGENYDSFDKNASEEFLKKIFRGNVKEIEKFLASNNYIIVQNVDKDKAELIISKFRNVGIKVYKSETSNAYRQNKENQKTVPENIAQSKNILKKIRDIVFNEEEINAKQKKEYAFYLTLIAVFFGSIWTLPWYESLFSSSSLTFNFPADKNGLVGLFLCLPIYLRGFIKFEKVSISNCLYFALNWALCATISQMTLGPDGSLGNMVNNSFLFFGIIMSWLGVRSVAGFCWLFFVFTAVIRSPIAERPRQFFGFMFLVFGFFSLLFQLDLTLKDLVLKFLSEFKNQNQTNLDTIKEDVADAAGKSVGTIRQTTATAIKATILK